jgi:hypothetical protein
LCILLVYINIARWCTVHTTSKYPFRITPQSYAIFIMLPVIETHSFRNLSACLYTVEYHFLQLLSLENAIVVSFNVKPCNQACHSCMIDTTTVPIIRLSLYFEINVQGIRERVIYVTLFLLKLHFVTVKSQLLSFLSFFL